MKTFDYALIFLMIFTVAALMCWMGYIFGFLPILFPLKMNGIQLFWDVVLYFSNEIDDFFEDLFY